MRRLRRWKVDNLSLFLIVDVYYSLLEAHIKRVRTLQKLGHNPSLSSLEFKSDVVTQKFLTGEFDTPITIEDNKVTLDMSVKNSALRNVDMYMFQDADDSQLHIYMPTDAFINYFVNLEIPALIKEGKLDPTDAAAVEKVFADMEARIQSINVSFVLKARK